MGFKFNPFIGNFDEVGGDSPFWLGPVATRAALPSGAADGACAVVLDEETIFQYDNATDTWYNTRVSLTQFLAAADAAGITIDTVTTSGKVDYRINLHAASSTTPGGVSTGTQNFAGDKTFDNDVTITGDLTVNGTTTTVNSTTLDVTDANITVNNGGTQATADLNDAGLTIEMSDATDVVLGYDSTTTSRMKLGDLGDEREIATISHSQTFSNKTISDANSNTISIDADVSTITNIDNDEIKAGAGIDVTKLHDGSVDNTEFGYLDGVTSSIQTQLDDKANRTLSNLTSPTAINQDLIPSGTRVLGSSTDKWDRLWTKAVTNGGNGTDAAYGMLDSANVGQGALQVNVGTPSGVGSSTALYSSVNASALSIFTVNEATSNSIHIETGNGTTSGDINLYTGTGTTRGDVNIRSRIINYLTDDSTYGDLEIGKTNVTVPPQSAFGAGINIQNTTIERDLYVTTVNNTAADGVNSGNVVLETGNLTNAGASGNSGDIIMRTGSNSGSGVRGAIRMVDNSILTASNGYVWTLTNNGDGTGQWVALPDTFTDDVFRVQDDGDNTKQIAFQASAITTSTTRTITMPDSDVDLGQIATNTTDIDEATKLASSQLIGGGDLLYKDYTATDSLQTNGTNGNGATLAYNASFGQTNNISVFAWIKTSNANASFGSISGHASSSASRRKWYIGMNNGPIGAIVSATGGSGASEAKFYQTTASYNDNQWHHFGFTFTTNTLKIYLDGAEVTGGDRNDLIDGTVNTLFNNTTEPLTLNSIFNGGTQFVFNGQTAHHTYWSKELTATEVQELYLGGRAYDLKTHSALSNLVLWFPVDGDTFGGGVISEIIGDQDATISGTVTIANDAPNSAGVIQSTSDMFIQVPSLLDTDNTVEQLGNKLIVPSTGEVSSVALNYTTGGADLTPTVGSIDSATIGSKVLLRREGSSVVIDNRLYLDDNQKSTLNDIDDITTILDILESQTNTTLITLDSTLNGGKLEYTVIIDADTDLYEKGTIEFIKTASGYTYSKTFIGDDALIALALDNSGNLQYTTSTYTGFVSGQINFNIVSKIKG